LGEVGCGEAVLSRFKRDLMDSEDIQTVGGLESMFFEQQNTVIFPIHFDIIYIVQDRVFVVQNAPV
jgi:hypothetical protein